MQHVACPGCGAPVDFKSTASVMAVCEFCRTTVLKDADSVRDLGKMSEVLEDYSPLQIGSTGRLDARSFAVIGRIQLKYSAGYWNEWYVLFDDGGTGWLSDASGQFAVTLAEKSAATLPLFDKLQPGRRLTVAGVIYTVSDVRTARCTGGQGELPFKVGGGWQARVADLRAGDRFLSLDYSDGEPLVFRGQSVALADLQPQLLRDPAQIRDAAGRFHGKIGALNCPSCGSPLRVAAGITVHAVCPSCHAQIDTTGATAAVLAAGAAVDAVSLTLELGSEASIDGARYTVLGAMRRVESGDVDGDGWTEYLLYAPDRPFLWLVETSDGWQRAQVLDRWPSWDGGGQVSYDGRPFNRRSAYEARVTFAAGSFNWRVSVGDRTRVVEFADHAVRLAAEATDEELTWSRSTPVALDQVRAWFGAGIHADRQPHPRYADTARRILIALFLVNAIPLLFATGGSLTYAVIAALAIYLPALYLDRLDQAGS